MRSKKRKHAPCAHQRCLSIGGRIFAQVLPFLLLPCPSAGPEYLPQERHLGDVPVFDMPAHLPRLGIEVVLRVPGCGENGPPRERHDAAETPVPDRFVLDILPFGQLHVGLLQQGPEVGAVPLEALQASE